MSVKSEQILIVHPLGPRSDEMLVSRNYQLLVVAAFAFLLKAYDLVLSPVIGALDPWGWVVQTRQYLAAGQLDLFFAKTGYPPTFLYVIAGVASLGVDAYDVIRYLPIISSLSVIPIYLLMNEIFESRGVAATTALLTVTARWYFMRTSIGIPEGFSHVLLGFTLYYLLKSLRTKRSFYQVFAAVLMTITILYYHFTILILAAFLTLLLLKAAIKSEKGELKVLGSIVIPSVLFSGAVWYFGVVESLIHTYLLAEYPMYQAPHVDFSVSGFVYVICYSIGKLGARALSTLGYVMCILALAGLGSLYLPRRSRETMRMKSSFLITYLVTLTLLAFVLEMLCNVGVSSTGAIRLYIFSYIAMPAAAFASQALTIASEALQRTTTRMFTAVFDAHFSRAIFVMVTVFVCILNLSAVNYYKAWSGKGIGLLESHYYVKLLTDEEYYALAYVRDNTPKDSTILTVGVEEGILTLQATVSRRTIVNIRDLVDEGKFMIANTTIMHSELVSEHSQSKIGSNGEGTHIYFISGIKKVNSEQAAKDEPPPPKKIVMEQLLTSRILSSKRYECVYRNDQVTVFWLLSISIQHIST